MINVNNDNQRYFHQLGNVSDQNQVHFLVWQIPFVPVQIEYGRRQVSTLRIQQFNVKNFQTIFTLLT